MHEGVKDTPDSDGLGVFAVVKQRQVCPVAAVKQIHLPVQGLAGISSLIYICTNLGFEVDSRRSCGADQPPCLAIRIKR